MVEGGPDAGNMTGAAQFSLSSTGTLVYAPGAGRLQVESVLGWVNGEGLMTPLSQGMGEYLHPRLSPDDGQVALTIRTDDNRGIGDRGELRDIFIYDLGRNTSERLTEDGFNDLPAWTPDGTAVTFASNRSGVWDLYSKPADRSGEAKRLTHTSFDSFSGSWSPNGSLVFYQVTETSVTGLEPSGGRDLWVLEQDREASVFLATEFNERAPSLSRDGRWLAYVSDRSGEDRVYVTPFPEGDRFIPVSSGAGTGPVWSRDGGHLFFRAGSRMMSVEFENGEVGQPRMLFEAPYVRDQTNGSPNYDVGADGRFLMIRRAESTARVHVVLNWHQELLERVPTP